jgi:hypothetical protein
MENASPPRPAKPRGRPSGYDPKFAVQARKLCALGAIDEQLGDFFGVTGRTVKSWRVRFADFADACKLGKEVADAEVQASLYHRAVGYSVDTEKILASGGRVFRVPFVEHYPPDVRACILWLTNRRSSEWRLNPKPEGDGQPADLLAQIEADAPRLIADEPGPPSPIL